MTQAFRIGDARSAALRFTFDGKTYEGRAGDTLASALLANGVHLVGRSFKYHRPRGILSAGSEEPNALVTIDRGCGRVTPNLRATQVELYEGLAAHSQNRWPSLVFDLGAAAGLASRLLPAGFYYKTFMWPPAAWRHFYEPLIRRAAGLGQAPRDPDPDFYAQQYAHCDVLVIGAGAAGLAAAVKAGCAGARVMLCDEQNAFGGSLLAEPQARIDDTPATEWAARQIESLRAMPDVRLLPRSTAFGMHAQNFIGIVERVSDHLAEPGNPPRERLWQVRARRIVLATGAHERPLVFPGDDRPGVMLADAARVYAHRHGVLVGRRIVVAAAHDSAYAAALDLQRAGAHIALIADLRDSHEFSMVEEARVAGLNISRAAEIVATSGRRRVASVRLRMRDGTMQTVACDALLMSGGWTPSVHLLSQARGALRFDDALQAFAPGALPPDISCAGACNGSFGLAAAIAEGQAAGRDAATASGFPTSASAAPLVDERPSFVRQQAHTPTSAPHPKAFVDFQNDVTSADIALAVREGFRSVEHIKRYTTTGMATDQGKTSNMNALDIAAREMGRAMSEVGLTTFRQPYTPVTFGALAGPARGDLYEPVRHTPSHEWALRRGAIFEDAGQWKRASAFPRDGEKLEAAVTRECRTVRECVGVFDASTLGKIEVAGPDALEFLNRMYVNDVSKLVIGRCRYALMLGENGFVMDDGIVGRLDAHRFHVTTTSGGLAHVLAHMEDFRQTEFTDLRVWLTDVTEQWATFAVQGPRAREIVAPLIEGVDVSAGEAPHMSLREGQILDAPLRLFRASFTGECGFEINVPSGAGPRIWEALTQRVEAVGGCAYGLEALDVLRAEKGYIIVGQETDGSTTPDDLGYGRMIGRAKPDFIGKRSLTLPHLARPDRPQLVGLLTRDPAAVLEEGSQIVPSPRPAIGAHALGHVTTARRSPTLGRTIALALVENGRARLGDTLYATATTGMLAVEVGAPVFYDPSGSRLDG